MVAQFWPLNFKNINYVRLNLLRGVAVDLLVKVSYAFESFQMFGNACKCVQMLSNAFKCFQMLSTAFKCFRMFSNASRCFQMLAKAFKCFQKLSNALKCFRTFSTALASPSGCSYIEVTFNYWFSESHLF